MQEPKSQLEQWHPIPLSFEHVLNYYKHLMTVLQSVLQKPLEARLKEDVFSSLNATTKKEPGTMLKTMSPVDRLLFLKHARSPTWEYDSLHPRLKLSDDRLVVSCNWRRMFYPCGPQRFDKLWQVLSRDAFLSGSHYWEVDLLQAGTGWWIGAAYPSIGRKGDSETCRLGWNRASWCIKRFDFEYWAFLLQCYGWHGSPAHLSLQVHRANLPSLEALGGVHWDTQANIKNEVKKKAVFHGFGMKTTLVVIYMNYSMSYGRFNCDAFRR